MIYVIHNGFVITMDKVYNHILSFLYIIILGIICTSFAIILFNVSALISNLDKANILFSKGEYSVAQNLYQNL